MALSVPGRRPCTTHTRSTVALASCSPVQRLSIAYLQGVRGSRRAPVAARAAEASPGEGQAVKKQEGASTDLKLIAQRTLKLIRPYWITNPDARKPRLALAGVVALSLLTTGVSVVFSFLGRDFFNALAQKDEAQFYAQLAKYLGGFAVGIPVFVFRDYFVAMLSLRWRAWMTEDMLGGYMGDRTFYNIAQGAVIDNPDQRLTADINNFTSSSLSLAFTFLTSLVDLVSFSGILFSIYPPLFGALLVYAVGGTGLSFLIGKRLVGLNFRQEAREADFRYGLVRVRENAESVAFYRGASSEVGLLVGRLGRVVENYGDLIKASRNLDFFQSAYRYIIILLPAAVVAPLFFRGEIEFGVVNQSQSAFSHILSDVSLVVYQFESLASFSAVVDRLGEFQETVEARGKFAAEDGADAPAETAAGVPFGAEIAEASPSGGALASVHNATLCTPNYARALVRDLTVDLPRGGRLLVMGPSGCGKTSLLRAVGGLWKAGTGEIATPPVTTPSASGPAGGMMFVPQRPYMVLGSLRQQLLYPAYSTAIIAEAVEAYDDAAASNPMDPAATPQVLADAPADAAAASNGAGEAAAVAPGDDALRDALHKVGLDELLERCAVVSGGDPWGMVADWATLLSLGEQQRLAMARVLLANPSLVLLDESTSALDLENEARLYKLLIERGVALVSVGHRDSLRQYHDRVLRLEGGETGGWRLEECAAGAAAGAAQ